MELTLETHGLAVGYRGRRVAEGLELALRPGEALALLGPNGGGKTTFLKTLLGLLPPLAGEVRLGGRPIETIAVRERARILAYVPQAQAGTFAYTVAEMVLMGRTAHRSAFAAPTRADAEIVRATMDRLGIAHLAERPSTRISGGERQLALIARALAQEPRIAVLDEPTASLDFGHQGRVMDEIARLAESGLAILFSTHDPNQARRYAGRSLLIRDGATLAEGASAAILDRARLERLYGAPVRVVASAEDVAFLPDHRRG